MTHHDGLDTEPYTVIAQLARKGVGQVLGHNVINADTIGFVARYGITGFVAVSKGSVEGTCNIHVRTLGFLHRTNLQWDQSNLETALHTECPGVWDQIEFGEQMAVVLGFKPSP